MLEVNGKKTPSIAGSGCSGARQRKDLWVTYVIIRVLGVEW